MRLFVAVDPSEDARAAVASAIIPWRDEIPTARWTDRGAWHVTLRFLGATTPDLVGRSLDRLADAAAGVAPFAARLDGLGAFPARGAARVLWAGIEDDDGHLGRLALAVDEAFGPPTDPERRPFRPHLTVARLHPAGRIPPGFVAADVEPVAFTVERVCLYRSHLGDGPARYELLGAAHLGTA